MMHLGPKDIFLSAARPDVQFAKKHCLQDFIVVFVLCVFLKKKTNLKLAVAAPDVAPLM